MDATDAFDSIGHSGSAMELMRQFYIGEMAKPTPTLLNVSKEPSQALFKEPLMQAAHANGNNQIGIDNAAGGSAVGNRRPSYAEALLSPKFEAAAVNKALLSCDDNVSLLPTASSPPSYYQR